MNGPLAGVKVIEVAGSHAASVAAGALSDLGATVLLIEPESGTSLRQRPGFHVWSRGKQSLTSPSPGTTANELAPGADIVIMDEDAWDASGRKSSARVTLVIGTLGNHHGGEVSRDASASAAEAIGGLMYTQQGSRDGPFYIVEEPAAFGTALLGAMAAVTSLYANAETESEVVSVSHLGGCLGMLLFSAVAAPDQPARVLPLDGDPKRITTPLIRFYKASDGWMVIGAPTPSLWGKLCIALDMTELISDPRFDGAPFNIQDPESRIALVDIVQARIAGRTVEEWLAHLREFGVICAPVLPPDSILDDEQVIATGMRAEVDHPTAGRIVEPGIPILFHNSVVSAARPSPDLNEHDPATVESFRAGALARTPARDKGHPLDGIRVLDLSGFAAAPGSARILNGLGADVTKVEGPDGDPFRFIGFSFASVNRGKRSVMLDLTKDEGRVQNERLIRNADIVLHNLRPALQAKTGLEPETVSKANPDAIQVTVYGYGSTGPYADFPAIDVVFESMSGGPLIQGGGVEPVGFSGGLADNGTSLMSALAMAAALYAKKQGMQGQQIELSLLRTTLYRHSEFLVRPLSKWQPETLRPDPIGLHAAHRLYEASDGWVFLAVTNDVEWKRLTALTSELPPALSPDDATWNETVEPLLTRVFASRSLDEWVRVLEESNIPGVPVHTFRDFALAAAAEGSPLVSEFQDPQWGNMVALHELVKFEGHRWKALGRAPSLGEHSEVIHASA